jgi:hypothetical protein
MLIRTVPARFRQGEAAAHFIMAAGPPASSSCMTDASSGSSFSVDILASRRAR